jgi:hypothetical protein
MVSHCVRMRWCGSAAREAAAAVRGPAREHGRRDLGPTFFLFFSRQVPRVPIFLGNLSIGFSVKNVEQSLFPLEFFPPSLSTPNFIGK